MERSEVSGVQTVLVVDDEGDVRQFVRNILLRHGYQVVEAADGVAAYELLRRQCGDIRLIVTDIKMPRMDGIALGKKVSAEFPSVEVLYISGFVSPQGSNEIPASRFLPKPFMPDALVRCVRKLCG